MGKFGSLMTVKKKKRITSRKRELIKVLTGGSKHLSLIGALSTYV